MAAAEKIFKMISTPSAIDAMANEEENRG